jgi:hypothetical protein
MRQALELALEALQFALHIGFPESSESQIKKGEKAYQQHRAAITAIKEALAQPEQPKVRTGDCLLVGVCASEGHKIQVKQEPWRESASDYERGVIDGRQMQAQSSVDKAVNRMAQPEQEPVEWGVDWGKAGDIPCVSIIKRLPDGGIEVIAVEYAPYSYITPPQRTWVGLTDEEKQEWIDAMPYDPQPRHCMILVNIIEAKLKEKNT